MLGRVDNDLIRFEDGAIVTFNLFNYLIGKKIDFTKRLGKLISIEKERGHVYVHDYNFLPGEIYGTIGSKLNYKCVKIDRNGYALMNPINHCLNVLILQSGDANQWIVIGDKK